jgi:hypothetical protein
MWIAGHTAFGYLVAKAGFSVARKPLRPDLVLMIFFFSNLIDATHFGWLRDLTHNAIGTVLFTALALLILDRLGMLRKGDGPVLGGVSILHATGDLLFGGYLPLFPFSNRVHWAFPWNSPENLVTESALGFLFVAVFCLSADFKRARRFSAGQRTLAFRDLRPMKALDRRFLRIYMFTLFYLLFVGQLVYYLLCKHLGDLLSGLWYFWIFLLAFALMLSVISAAAFTAVDREL